MQKVSTENKYDLIIIGSGPAGIYAAIQSAKLKKRVCIIEKETGKIGGSWIHWGTIPSKTLRESLDTIHNIKNHVGESWVRRVIEHLNTGKLFSRSKKVSLEQESLMRKYIRTNKIHIYEGYGVVESQNHVRVLSTNKPPVILNGENLLLCTGTKPLRPDDIPFDGWRIVDTDELVVLENVPDSLIICGAGVTGCEYACIFGALGVKVTLIDKRERILSNLDQEVGKELKKMMELLGIKFYLKESLSKVYTNGPRAFVELGEHKLDADVFCFAAGRVPSTERMGLEKLGIKKDKRGVVIVNDNFQTQINNIYAAGDIIGEPALAATSSQQGRYVACHAFGHSLGKFPKVFPVGVYTIPELSMVGKTEEVLIDQGVDYVVGRCYYYEIARGHIRGDQHGLIKLLICSKTQKILGIHIVGADACNLIHIGMSLMLYGGVAQDLINMIFNHPTLAEGFRIAAFNGLNKIFKDGFFPPISIKK